MTDAMNITFLKLLAILVVTTLCVTIFTGVLGRHAEELRLLDYPCARKRHGAPVPIVGGISLFIAFVLSLTLLGSPDIFTSLLIVSAIMLSVGVADDIIQLNVRTRFAVQILATIAMISSQDIWIRDLGISIFNLDHLGLLGLPFTLFAVVGLTNAINMVDGLDGLASGHAVVALSSLVFAIHMTSENIPHLEILVTWTWAIFIFFLININVTKIPRTFLGDAGSLLLGFILSWLLIIYSQIPISRIDPVAVLWCVSLPVFDALITIFSRIRNQTSPFTSDRSHLHHILIDNAISERKVLVYTLMVAIFINLAGIYITDATGSLSGLLFFMLIFLAFCFLRHQLSIRIKRYQ